MNLIPIDAGGAPTELVGGDASPGGDFAALMTGLMTGDTQIVPLIDFPAGEQLPDGTDAAAFDETGDVAASILEFVGTPPAGLTITPLGDSEQSATTPEVQASIDGAPVPAAPVLDSIVADSEAAMTNDHADGQALATVHPIRTHVANTPSATPDTDTAPSDTLVTGLTANGRPGQRQGTAAPASNGADPEVTVAPSRQTATPTHGEAVGVPPFPTVESVTSTTTATATTGTTAAETTATMTATAEATARQASTDQVAPPTSTPDQTGLDAFAESDLDVETGTVARPLDTVRSGSSITQPAMVGIARRVEEAIAALATKPDPKIVTLQLDELDGLRLTVALRPDGIHLSSSGDATLTTEIERALASRGFDMASGSDRGRQGSEENSDDGWRPQPPTPGRQPRTNQPGIRL